MCDWSTTADLSALLLFEIVGSNPEGMVFPLKIELPLVHKLLLVDSVYSVLLDMYISIMIILPEGDEVGVGGDLRPFLVVEVLPARRLVAHQ